jgi:hypothetical protein
MKNPSIALALLLATTSLHAQERPTLSYTVEEGRGTTTKDGGTGNVTLEIGSGMGWSQPGAGVNGGTAIGCVADGDIALRNAHPIKDIPEVAAITITGLTARRARAGISPPCQQRNSTTPSISSSAWRSGG